MPLLVDDIVSVCFVCFVSSPTPCEEKSRFNQSPTSQMRLVSCPLAFDDDDDDDESLRQDSAAPKTVPPENVL